MLAASSGRVWSYPLDYDTLEGAFTLSAVRLIFSRLPLHTLIFSTPYSPPPSRCHASGGGQRVVLFLLPRLPFSVRPLENPRYFKFFSFPFPSAQASTWHEIVKSCCIFDDEASSAVLIVIDFGPYDGSGYFP
ncbi:uncharacterized protein LACBIDRAFT_325602 [Laccaria bicolor S238N-H82]|uniref:Predicted protein n=1 Tax=Laccaria bicolor (strain S238N-H82 / ATCC MYA-4686) TaxID=486041 RepID=B0D5L2_LACBS|nr:uncharacterized protein LACBIDRAFT_325602 [Laccaria bicolor S238N-H82]EDR10039.1 predicted protein [Laccaria bicolor S238N-H82]|eukprot:XP_001879424.1 predicted protein [Laccaria bicolor S238N-H82]